MSQLLDDIRDVQPQAKLELSPRELQVVGLIADGLTYAEIGRKLGLTHSRVRDAQKGAFRRLGARNSAHAVAICFRCGLLD